jgi:hypothetical protein
MITTLQASCSQKHQTVTLTTHTNLQEMSIPSLQRICSSPSIQPLILLKTLVVLIIATDRQEHSQSHVVVFFIETLTLYCSSHSAFRRLDLNCAISSTCARIVESAMSIVSTSSFMRTVCSNSAPPLACTTLKENSEMKRTTRKTLLLHWETPKNFKRI